jgi:SEC-C motif-containing protein
MAFMDWIKRMLTPKPSPAHAARSLGRNDLCWCGSGKKYKRCHLSDDTRKRVEAQFSAQVSARNQGGGMVPPRTAKKSKAGRNLPPEAAQPPQGR